MMERIRARFFPKYGKSSAAEFPRIPLRGNAHHVIVVKAPNDIFTEAIFLLRDDCTPASPAASAELLRQAKAAAEGYTASVSVRDRQKRILIMALSALLALETAGLIVMLRC